MTSPTPPLLALLGALLPLSAATRQDPVDLDPFAPIPGLQPPVSARGGLERGTLKAFAQRADGVSMAMIEFTGGKREFVRVGDHIALGADGGLVMVVRELAPQCVRLTSTDDSYEVWVR